MIDKRMQTTLSNKVFILAFLALMVFAIFENKGISLNASEEFLKILSVALFYSSLIYNLVAMVINYNDVVVSVNIFKRIKLKIKSYFLPRDTYRCEIYLAVGCIRVEGKECVCDDFRKRMSVPVVPYKIE